MRRQVVTKAHVTERAFAERHPIDPHLAVLHHAVELDGHVFVLLFRWKHKSLPIPPNAMWQPRTRTAGLIRLRERPFNAPVMRQVKLAPLGIIKARLRCAGRIGFEKFPIVIK